MSTEIDGFLTVPEAAGVIGVTDSLVRRWVRDGRLPHKKIGEKVRVIPAQAVEKMRKTARKPGRPKAS